MSTNHFNSCSLRTIMNFVLQQKMSLRGRQAYFVKIINLQNDETFGMWIYSFTKTILY